MKRTMSSADTFTDVSVSSNSTRLSCSVACRSRRAAAGRQRADRKQPSNERGVMEQIAEDLQAVLETQPDATSLLKYNRVLLVHYDLIHKGKVPVPKFYIARSFGYIVHNTDRPARRIAAANNLLSVLLGLQLTTDPTVPFETLQLLVNTALQKPLPDVLQASKARYKDDALDAWRAASTLKSGYGVIRDVVKVWHDSGFMQTGDAAADARNHVLLDGLLHSIAEKLLYPFSSTAADGVVDDVVEIVVKVALLDAAAMMTPAAQL